MVRIFNFLASGFKILSIFGFSEFMAKRKYIFLTLLVTFVTFTLRAQIESVGVPFIRNYTNVEYNAGNQNFAVIQDYRGVMYFGSSSVLEFDGIRWTKINTPNSSIVYSFAKDKNGRIYVGAGNGELGYLGADSVGNMIYISLSKLIPEKKRQFSKVPAIEVFDDAVIFLTPLALYIYKNEKFTIIDVQNAQENNKFIRPLRVGDKLYIQEHKLRLWEYKNEKLVHVPGGDRFSKPLITGMFPYRNDSILITLWQEDALLYKNGTYSPAKMNPLIRGMYTAGTHGASGYALGLFTEGVLITDNNFNIKNHIANKNGLQSNTILSIFSDPSNNVWAGLGTGISYINSNSPYTFFNDKSGLSGVTSSSILHDSILYVSSSTGIFFYDWHKKTAFDREKFTPIKNSKGASQIWKIDTVAGQLLCAGTLGLFYIENQEAKYILEDQAIRTFIRLQKHPNIILAAGGTGLSVFEFKDGKWLFRNKIQNFTEDSKHLEECKDGYIWISNQNKGVIRLKLNETVDSVLENQLFNAKSGLPNDIGNYVFKLDGKVIFATDSGIYKFDSKENRMLRDPEYVKYFGIKKITNLHQADNSDIWFKEQLFDKKQNVSHWELALLKRSKDSFEIVSQPFLKLRDNIHSISTLSSKELIVGTEKGFARFDMNYKNSSENSYRVLIRNLETINGDSLIFGGTFVDAAGIPTLQQPKNLIPVLDYNYNGLRFTFSALFYEEPEKNMYKFILIGDDKEAWSDWTAKTEKEYSNLSPGKYTFKVIAKNLYSVESEPAEYQFEILPPWYQTIGAYLGYLILFVVFVWGIVQLSLSRVKKQKEHLERIVEERTSEIQHKNQELSALNDEISAKNKDITASINYAKRIQEAMLPLENTINQGLRDYFIFFKPRDIVSGDFYWYAKKGNKIFITAVDCTGHGVPGAFMSMIGSEILTTIVGKGITSPDQIMEKMNDYVRLALKQEETSNQDGMDMALCVIDEEAKTVEFGGAKNPLVYITNGELFHVKADKKGIGGGKTAKQLLEPYEMHTVNYTSPTWFYVFTDGYQDQFGGPDNRKFMIKALKNLLLEIHQKPFAEQHQILNKTINDWMAKAGQTDDILLIGFKL